MNSKLTWLALASGAHGERLGTVATSFLAFVETTKAAGLTPDEMLTLSRVQMDMSWVVEGISPQQSLDSDAVQQLLSVLGGAFPVLDETAEEMVSHAAGPWQKKLIDLRQLMNPLIEAGMLARKGELSPEQAQDAHGKMVQFAIMQSTMMREPAEAMLRPFLGAQARLRNDKDGKQSAKQSAFGLWKNWQSGNVRHKSGAAFARHVVENLPIESTKTVERWMKDWAAEAKK